mgnify:CR=1 FL=1
MPSYPTDAEITEARVARDWAGIEIHDRDPDGECDGALRARAIRALREGRAAYLHVSTYGGLPTLWASIACEHGEAVADLWFYGEGPRDVVAEYGAGCPGFGYRELARVRHAVKVVEPRRVLMAAE